VSGTAHMRLCFCCRPVIDFLKTKTLIELSFLYQCLEIIFSILKQ